MAYKLVFEKRGVLFQFDESSSPEELRKANTEIWEHPDFHNMRYQIWDMRNTSGLEMTEEEAFITAKFDDAAFRQFKSVYIAVVTTNPAIIRASEIYAQHVDTSVISSRVFNTVEEARHWIENS